MERFWKRWKREYLLELREFHRTRAKKGLHYTLKGGDIVTVYDEGHPRGMWRLGKIENLIEGVDEQVRGVYVRVMSKKGHMKTLRRPIQHIYPLEVISQDETPPSTVSNCQESQVDNNQGSDAVKERPKRMAAVNARAIIRTINED